MRKNYKKISIVLLIFIVINIILLNFNVSSAKGDVKKNYRRDDVESAIEKMIPNVINDNNSMDWVALGLNRTGNKNLIPKNYISNVIDKLDEYEENFSGKWTEYQRMAIGVISAGGDPKQVGNYDLIELSSNGDLAGQGINALAFGLITLDLKDYDDSNYVWNRDKIVEKILESECPNSKTGYGPAGWVWGGPINFTEADVDMTSMVVTSLAPYYLGEKKLGYSNKFGDLNKAVKEAVDRAVAWLSHTQEEDGSMSTWGTSTSESTAQTIVALCSINEDPTSKKFTKGGANLIDDLLKYEVDQGGFAHIKIGNELSYNGMATEQALYALAQYLYFLDEKGSIYNFGKDSNLKYKINLSDGLVLNNNLLSIKIDSDDDLFKDIMLNNSLIFDNILDELIDINLVKGINDISIALKDNKTVKKENYKVYVKNNRVDVSEENIKILEDELSINLYSDINTTARLLVVEYDDNIQESIVEKNIKLEKGSNNILVKLNDSYNSKNKYKLFIWDYKMDPLMDGITLDL